MNIEQLQALSDYFKLHPITRLQYLIDREYRRLIDVPESSQTKVRAKPGKTETEDGRQG